MFFQSKNVSGIGHSDLFDPGSARFSNIRKETTIKWKFVLGFPCFFILKGLWQLVVNLQAFLTQVFLDGCFQAQMDTWLQSFKTRMSDSSKPRKPAPVSKPPCLLKLCVTQFSTVEKSLCIENRRLHLHHRFQLAHYVKFSMHGHKWNVFNVFYHVNYKSYFMVGEPPTSSIQ